ncbi:MAG TPA: DNA cytosine methyltransferase [Saprospiraceae bacterium]|nr:DNA cytosine methyltransferase [Saprospiraceae bacterium]HMQ81385.1 DNA cytosine methyltransferase [Saprospiraceae bacterium]
MKKYLSLSEAAELVGKSKETLRRWDREGILTAVREPVSNYRVYKKEDVQHLMGNLFSELEEPELSNEALAENNYNVLELFAGAGGLAVGFEQAGLECTALNEIDKWACQTLRRNRPNWKILEGDVKSYHFGTYHNKVDVVTGGFPCQAFSYAGKKLGLNDAEERCSMNLPGLYKK